MTTFESFAADMITNNIDMMQEQFKQVDDLESQLVVAKNHIRDLENKNKLLVDKLANEQLLGGSLLPAHAEQRIKELEATNDSLVDKLKQKAMTQPCQRDVDALEDRIEELEKQLLLATRERNDAEFKLVDLQNEFDDLKQKHQTTVEELEELQGQADFSKGAAKGWAIRYKSLEKDFDNYRNEFDERNTKLMIKLGLAYNQSVDLLVSCNLVVANLLSEADLDWSVVAALMQQVGSLNHTLEELSHV